MPVLNRHLYEKLCDSNKAYLRNQNLFIDEEGSDIDLGEDHHLINQLIINEKARVQACDKQFQNEKNKVKYTILFMSAAIASLGAGFALAPLFIVSTIVLPVLPVLLIGFAIVGITKLFLNLRVNRLNAHATQAINILDQLKEVDKNAGREIVSTFNNGIQEIKNITEAVSEKIDELEAKTTHNFSQLLTKAGMFSTAPIPIPNADPANELHNTARASSPTPTQS
jgi:hypothetical protein